VTTRTRRAAGTPAPPRGLPLVRTVAVPTCVVAVVLVATVPWRTLPATPGSLVPADPARDFSAAQLLREDAFHAAVRPPAYASLLVALLAALLLGLTPAGAWLVERVGRRLGSGHARTLVGGVLALSLLTNLAALPFDARAEVVLRRYGLSTQTWTGWALDRMKAFGLSVGLLVVAALALYAVLRRRPRDWWAPAAAAAAVLVVVVSFGYPVAVEPLFNRFAPLPPGALRSSLLAMARADGVPVSDVLVADASRRTSALNAYVSGFGSTRRIVVDDTALAHLPPRELRLIVAHELGHAKRGDVLYGTLLGALGAALAVGVLGLALRWRPLLARAGVDDPADPRSVALLLALVAVMTAGAGPVQLLVSRRIEARADVHALDLTHDPVGFARMQRQLAVTNLSDLDPDPLVYGLFGSHPTPPERIALAREWARLHGRPEPPARP